VLGGPVELQKHVSVLTVFLATALGYSAPKSAVWLLSVRDLVRCVVALRSVWLAMERQSIPRRALD
jgi:hypothetical protein